MNRPRAEAEFPLIRRPRRQSRLLRLAWGTVTLALWLGYGLLALPLLSAVPDGARDLVPWVVGHRLDITLLWIVGLCAAGAALLLVAWAELDGIRQRGRVTPRQPDALASAIALRLHASNALRRQLAGGRIVRLQLDERARPVRAEILPLPGNRKRRRDQTGARVCPSPRTTKRSTVNASRPIGP